MSPYYDDGNGITLYNGDCRDVLRALPDASINCCVTSPPYFGLRDYGHGAQIGLEQTPDEYVARMVAVFAEVRRVLRDDGTLWLNLGDSYAGSWGNYGGQNRGKGNSQRPIINGSAAPNPAYDGLEKWRPPGSMKMEGIKPKDLIGIPWMVAFALRADDWYLRQDIIWSKPNPMPESVTDRCTKAHEYLFLLSKSERYHCDMEAVAEDCQSGPSDIAKMLNSDERIGGKHLDACDGKLAASANTNVGRKRAVGGMRPQLRRAMEIAESKGLTDEHFTAIRACGIADAGKALVTTTGAGRNSEHMKALAAEAKQALGGYYREFLTPLRRNRRSVWTVATQPYSGAHFATFPPGLVEPCIRAGCPAGGVVLDPFFGAGTTGLVCQNEHVRCIGIELNPAYCEIARNRLSQTVLFTEGAA